MKFPVPFAALILLVFFTAASCTERLVSTSETRLSLGTYVQLTVVGPKELQEKTRHDIDDAFREIGSLEKRFDYRSVDGPLWKFNNATALRRQDDELLFSLVVRALDIAELTDGYFDPTVLPLVELWGFDGDEPRLPGDGEIREALRRVGYRRVHVGDGTIEKPRDVKLDLSGIAKGEIVDLVADFLREKGYNDFLVNAGGDIYVSGLTDDRKKWRIAIQDPVHENRYSGVVEKSDAAIVTSGDYERFFVEAGVRYSHLFNPKTGYPASDLKSVSIIADKTAFADAVATAVFSMGSERGYDFLIRNDIPGFLIRGAKGSAPGYAAGGKADDRVVSRSTPRFWD